MRNILAVMAVCCCLFNCFESVAQTSDETELYNKTVRKPNIRNLEKFMEVYPKSVYYTNVLRIRDSLLFTPVNKEDIAAVRMFAITHSDSPLKEEVTEMIRDLSVSGLSRDDAKRILGGSGSSKNMVGMKMDDGEYVVKISLLLDGSMSLSTYHPDGTKASMDRVIPRYELGDVARTRMVDSLYVVHVNYYNMLAFSYINECHNGDYEYIQVLYDYRHDIGNYAAFFGKDILGHSSKTEYKIEGQYINTISGGIVSDAQRWVHERVKENSALVTISQADQLTDRSINWWLSKNPNACTSATKLSFGTLDKSSSIVSAYKSAEIVKGEKFNAAIVDFRGYTSVIAYSKTTGNYQLVWTEPICKNKDTDRLLNTVYFERGTNTLVIFFYEGRNTFKYRVNLADKSIRR